MAPCAKIIGGFFPFPGDFLPMSFDEFQQLARLFAAGALDEEETFQFMAGRKKFGRHAEAFITQCHKLGAALALSLRPCAPDPRTKERLLAMIQNMQWGGFAPRKRRRLRGVLRLRRGAFEGRFAGRS